MCLSIKMRRPADVLSEGEHEGFEWVVVANRESGFRCGYVRVPLGHPWHGKEDEDLNCDVHGGITFAEEDEPCDGEREDNAWWLGFDCGHCGDGIDLAIMTPNARAYRLGYDSALPRRSGEVIRSTEYVEEECKSLCEQAACVARRSQTWPRH